MILSLLVGGAALLGDRITKKAAVSKRLPPSLLAGRVVLRHVENRGLAGSRLQGNLLVTTALPSVALAAAAAILLPSFAKQDILSQTGTALLLSGGGSNLFDRLTRGSVTDMISFPRSPGKLKRLVWNLADFSLLLGVLCTVFSLFITKK